MLAFLITLLILITFHEYGHFFVARKLGVKVLVFSVGFGRPLLKWRGKDGVQYQVSWIPLGGYVKMLDGRIHTLTESLKSVAFDTQPIWKRFLIVSAGPIANLLLAWVLYTILFTSGLTGYKALVQTLSENSTARELSVPAPSEIIAVDGQSAKTWESVSYQLLKRFNYTETEITFLTEDKNSQTISIPTSKLSEFAHPMLFLRDFGLVQQSLGIPAVAGEVMKDGPAERAGLQKGDRILAVAGEAITDWPQLVKTVKENPNQPLSIDLIRDERELTLTLTPGKKLEGNTSFGFIGLLVEQPSIPESFLYTEQYSFPKALMRAFDETLDKTLLTLQMLKNMVVGLVSSESLGGPVAIAQGATSAFDSGFLSFVSYLALISISLGVLNLLPIPILDGGHLFFMLIEAVRGKALSDYVQMQFFKLGAAFLIGLTFFALFNDLGRMGIF